MSRDHFDHHTLGERVATDIYWFEARDAVKLLRRNRTGSHSKQLSAPRCQQCLASETLACATENNMDISQNIKNRATISSSNSTSEFIQNN